MRVGLIATLLVGLPLVAAPVTAQSDPGPPHAGTQTRCCAGYRITVHHGVYAPPGVRLSLAGIPATWSVVTIVAWPEPATGNAYAIRVPGQAVDLAVWDPATPEIRLRGTRGVPLIQPYDEASFSVRVPNAIGGAFPAAGRVAVFTSHPFPAVVRVRVTSAGGHQSPVYTVRVTTTQ